MCAMPRRDDGPSARAQTAASTGVSSPTSCRSASSPSRVSGPLTVSPASVSVTWQPIAARRSRRASPACVVSRGQSRTVTAPPVTAARARKGPALDRSGSMVWSTARTGPRETRQRLGSPSSTATPWARSIATVIATCGCEGIGLPSCTTSTPWSKRAPASSRAETNWLEPEASRTTRPPRTLPAPRTVKGRRSPSTTTPRDLSAVSTSPTGRARMWGSPSNATGPSASPATGGTNRVTVPARPQSTSVCPVRRPGVTAQSSPEVSTGTPSDVRASAISRVSRDRRAPRTTAGASASAPSTRARLVSDLLPGSDTSPCTGPRARGTGHGRLVDGALLTGAAYRGSVGRAGRDRSAEVGLGDPRLGPRLTRQHLGLAAYVLGRATGPPGDARTPFGVDRREQQTAHHRDVLEELDPL